MMVSTVIKIMRERIEAKAICKVRGGYVESVAVKKGESPLCIINNSFTIHHT